MPDGGNRTYADFTRRSPVPARDDANIHTPRNSPPLVNAFRVKRSELSCTLMANSRPFRIW